MQTGFGLVEIMVGLVIGLLTTLVIMQVLPASRAKRTTSGSADAQTSRAVALYLISRDVKMAVQAAVHRHADELRAAMIDHDSDPGTDAIASACCSSTAAHRTCSALCSGPASRRRAEHHRLQSCRP